MAKAQKPSEPVIGGLTADAWVARLQENWDVTCEQLKGLLAAAELDSLMRFARHGHFMLSWLASKAIEQLGPKAAPAVPEIIAELANDQLSGWAQSLLRGIGVPAIPELLKALKDNALARHAARPLGEIRAKGKEVIPALVELLNSPDEKNQLAAIGAIAGFGKEAKAAVPYLMPFLSKKSWNLRVNATEALASMGKEAISALPALEQALRERAQSKRSLDKAECTHLVRAIHDIAEKPMPPQEPKPPASEPGASTIDFGRTKKQIAQLVADGISYFVEEHPDMEVSCIGLSADGHCPWVVGLCLETPENSEKHVKKWAHKEGYFGQDKLGRFNNNIYEFAYSEYETTEFDWWPNFSDIEDTLKIKMPNGKIVRPNLEKYGDVAFHKPLCELMEEVLREAMPPKSLRLAKPFRLGVQIADGDGKFWIAK